MKNLFILLLSLFSVSIFSQNFKYEYNGRYTPVIKKEKLGDARFISDIMPEFSRYFTLQAKERTKFNQLLKLENSAQGSFSYPSEYFHQQENYEKIIDYVSIEISTTCNGKVISSQSRNNTLTTEQKNNLLTADLGTDIAIKIKFRYKYQATGFPDDTGKTYEAKYSVTVVPDMEAQFPGGFKQLTKYINENVINKRLKELAYAKFQNLVARFTINEEGKVLNPKIDITSGDLKTDKLLFEAITKMPKWKPAENAKGIKIKQEFTLPLGGGGC